MFVGDEGEETFKLKKDKTRSEGGESLSSGCAEGNLHIWINLEVKQLHLWNRAASPDV